MRRRPFGPAAWIVDELDDATAWAESARRAGLDGVVEIVPAEDSVVVRCAPSWSATVGGLLDAVDARPGELAASTPVTIDVVYDGEDLAAVAEATGLTVEAVVDLHASGTYTVAFCGFSPGFAYLRGIDDRLRLPRRDRPRTIVPAGSVAIAAGYSAVYPSPSPGGWHLLGRTERVVWDVERRPPALLVPGTRVSFRPAQT